ncbi:hypothetical protein [Ferruginibacter sp.]|nr:hypothetical protein [Ferruginibacter sp.]
MEKELKEAIITLQAFGENLIKSDNPSIMIDAIYNKLGKTQEQREEILRCLYDLRDRKEIEFDKLNDSQIHLLPSFSKTS